MMLPHLPTISGQILTWPDLPLSAEIFGHPEHKLLHHLNRINSTRLGIPEYWIFGSSTVYGNSQPNIVLKTQLITKIPTNPKDHKERVIP